MHDEELEKIQVGDTAAFARWMAVAEPELRDGLRGFADSVDVEAVLQETLLRVWQVAPRFEPDGRPNALLRLGVRIARNLALDEARRLSRRPPREDDFEARLAQLETEGPRPSDPFLAKFIEDCRDHLPPRPRQALDARLTDRGAVDDATLAARLGMKRNTFLQNFTRARKMLAECLEGHGVDLPGEMA